MKKILMLAMVLGVLVSGCSVIEENKSLKVKNKELEKQVETLGKQVETLQQLLSAKENNEHALNGCLNEAERWHDNALKLNDKGGSKSDHEKGIYTVSAPLLEQIKQEYHRFCDECYRRYRNK